MSLRLYNKKRDFEITPEPSGKFKKSHGWSYVIQKHAASHLHYDFRLELDGVMKSWAIPKGPSLDPKVRRLAVEVEDHPVSYSSFEGEIPPHQYGAGRVIVWDRGTWHPISEDVEGAFKKGRIEFELRGEKLKGRWLLFRTRGEGKKTNWLLIKRTDRYATQDDILVERPESVVSGRLLKGEKTSATNRHSPGRERLRKTKRRKSRGSANFPDFIEPQLATLTNEPPMGTGWIHEIKYDGYRTLAYIRADQVKLLTRHGLDWTSRYPTLAKEIAKSLGSKVKNAVFDGEIVAVDEKGRSRFALLQQALSKENDRALVYYVFDLLHLNGEDLTSWPLRERKEKLHECFAGLRSRRLVLSETWSARGDEVLQQSCHLGLEGVVSKRANASYTSGRSDTWAKSKCGFDQEFVIAGYTPPQGSRNAFGALLLGAYDKGELKYVGRVGTGFTATTLQDLKSRFDELESEMNPFQGRVPQERRVQWLLPRLVAQIQFGSWTADGLIRHASFQGLREDKPAYEVGLDRSERRLAQANRFKKEESMRSSKTSRDSIAIGGIEITHAGREIFPGTKISKADLAEYYLRMRSHILPHVKNRPMSILRCPAGLAEECFFQKHVVDFHSPFIHAGEAELHEQNKSKENFLYVDAVEGLLSLTQMGAIEFHVWNSTRKAIERPDTVVFDLDPGPGVGWSRVVDAAEVIHESLRKLRLKSFLKVTGGKGLHVHVPVMPLYTWDEIKSFANAMAKKMAAEEPSLYTSNSAKAARGGRIYLDYLRNGYGATAVAPYSVRAREGAPIALPVRWRDLDRKIKPNEFTLDNLKSVLKHSNDPWSGYFAVRQKISLLEEYHRLHPRHRPVARRASVAK